MADEKTEKTGFQKSIETMADMQREAAAQTAEDDEFDENEDDFPAHKEKPDAREKDLHNEPPEWFIVPANMRWPGHGKQVYYHRIPGEWTDRPDKGERQIALWSNTVGDEKWADIAARGGSGDRTIVENTKRMIRVIDGEVADWTGKTANVDKFWNEVGPKVRALLREKYLQLHTLTPMERLHFFTECSAVSTSI